MDHVDRVLRPVEAAFVVVVEELELKPPRPFGQSARGNHELLTTGRDTEGIRDRPGDVLPEMRERDVDETLEIAERGI